jgi:HEAT repeat protein
VAIEPSDDAFPELAAKKADYALSVISDSEYERKDPDCFQAAMHYLGVRGVQRAIPKLIALLDYHVEVLGRKPAGWQEYPAISSLSSFGVTAVPALVAEISKDPDEIKRKNALFALLDIRDARFPGTAFPSETTE